MATEGQIIPPGMEEEGVVISSGSLSKLEEADRSHQVATARRYPREITKFRNQLKEIAMANQSVAMEMMYSLPRAGKQLTGPSVRFAEAVLSCWGNARAGVEIVEVDTKDKVVVAEGRFYDCEKNVGIAIRVRRSNVMKKLDTDSYSVTGTAASSIALRNAILRGVPKALWADIFEVAKQTAAGDVKSMDEIRAKLVKVFTALGITESRLFAALEVSGMADLGAEEIIAMKAWHKQLVEKEMTLEQIFGFPEDDEIERLMAALGWNETQKRMSKTTFGKDKQKHLEYVRTEATKAGIKTDAPAPKQAEKAQPIKETAEEKPAPEAADVVEKEEEATEMQADPPPPAAQSPAAAKPRRTASW